MTSQNFFLRAGIGCMLLLLVCCASPAPSTQQEASAGRQSSAVVVQELVKSSHSWDGTLLPAYPQGQPEVTILRITIPAGTRLPLHHHPVINAGVLLKGQLTVVAEQGQKLHLHAGDPIVEMVHTPHYGINEGDEPAEIIVFYAGVTGKPITVLEPH